MIKNEMMVQLAVENLERAYSTLEGFAGLRKFISIKQELAEDYCFETQILRNDKFELTFNFKEDSLLLKTTYSNQLIDQEFIQEMMKLESAKGLLEASIKSYVNAVKN